MKCAKIGNRMVGDGYPCFISLEPGATHTGLESAKMMVEAAAAAGADAVKFQTVMADELMSNEDVMIDYQTPMGKRSESVYAALKRRELTFDEWRELKDYCDKQKILFISAPSGPATVDLLAEIGSAAIKVSKSDVNNRYLIKLIAAKGLPVIMDAREKFEDVQVGIDICETAGVKDIIIMHCPSGYPVQYAGIHLKAIPHIKAIFDYPVAYSDHSVGDHMNYAALGVGANYLEKTITLDRSTNAVEHFMSLEPSELKHFVDNIRNIEEAFGDPRIIFSSRVNATHRRSILAERTIKKGQTIAIEDLGFKRPGTYISVERYEEIVGAKATRDIPAGEFLAEADFEK
ncbi:MAG: N-acetylneuraminate synthase family protein [Planctomycetes bacterium]|nr:N-acetylneuraminate synthase family protein [Planctomycetota bacterium]